MDAEFPPIRDQKALGTQLFGPQEFAGLVHEHQHLPLR